ncbi:hypothetical protein KMZ32_10930 [Phycicoccus sp. MAQZ13P-2]|uniref:hypothetical protein n=1 Tax=Phycicoccus mangrovi TaxID=2840470 RepID=UPI001C001CBC|nr:hypothetical protein [Phycicoccus mangrovi]MBT9257779.1 hypothetical protein [Phycicoccus mangrovi]MBT9274584.1 hypothetical protein [Phycicoccus mangrovi]
MDARAPLLLVVGASGGLGASSLALAVGRRLAGTHGGATVVDLDVGRGGLDVTAGVEHLPGHRWAALARLRGTAPARPLLDGFPAESGARVLAASGASTRDLPPEAVTDTLTCLAEGGEPVVVDLPAASPHLSDLLPRSGLVVVLAGLQTRRLADADALVGHLVDVADGCVETPGLRLVTRGPRPDEAVLDDLRHHFGVPHLHHLPDDPQVEREAERGLWPGSTRGALRRCAEAVAAAFAEAS